MLDTNTAHSVCTRATFLCEKHYSFPYFGPEIYSMGGDLQESGSGRSTACTHLCTRSRMASAVHAADRERRSKALSAARAAREGLDPSPAPPPSPVPCPGGPADWSSCKRACERAGKRAKLKSEYISDYTWPFKQLSEQGFTKCWSPFYPTQRIKQTPVSQDSIN